YGRISISRVVHGIDDIEDPNDDEHEAAYENETQAMQLPTTECQLKPYCIPSPTLPDQVIFEQASLAIAKISYVKGMYSYVASGGLLHNSTNRPLFLTANHCIASQSVAASCEALWAYREACDSAAPNSTFIKTLGATLIATSRLTDFTLLQLKSNPPTGSYYFRWSDEDVSRSSETLYRIHHPHGYPQHYQISRIRNLGGCSMPIGNFIYSNPQLGITATGSSGSPCFRATDGHAELMGQLYGACSSSPQTCNHANVDGAFSATYPMIKAYL
ncbi:MAG TPA: trypsin-like peptidase domain-containing protein, partial [Chitinophagaceae bacterium]|nr:trypsin-like peptidase domain-containing protein [Chitinophagaceae bacterium]